jgi:hypothetical protein
MKFQSDYSRFSELVPSAQDDDSLVIKHGEPIADLFLPYVRIDSIDTMLSTVTNSMMALLSDKNSASPLRSLVAQSEFTFVVIIQFYQKGVASYNTTVDTIYQGERSGHSRMTNQPCYIYNVHIATEIPSEHDIQLISLIVHWFLKTSKKVTKKCKPLFVIGCQQGLNRTGYVICSLLTRLFGIPIHQSIQAFRKAHYPGIVKQHFIDQLYKRYENVHACNESVSMFLRMPMALSIENLIHRKLQNSTQRRDKMITQPTKDREVYTVYNAFQEVIRERHTTWLGEELSINITTFLYTKTIPSILTSIATLLPNSGIQGGNIRYFRNGFVRPFPCNKMELDSYGNDVFQELMISIKANGRHATLIVCPIGVFVIERTQQVNEVKTLPFVFVSSEKIPLQLTVLEVEIMEYESCTYIFPFDILYSEDATIEYRGKNVCCAPFNVRQDVLRGLLSANVASLECGTKRVCIIQKTFYPLTSTLLKQLATNLDEKICELYPSVLTRQDGNDGFILSKKSANILGRVDGSDTIFPHLKLKEVHSVDLSLTIGGHREVKAHYAEGWLHDNAILEDGLQYDTCALSRDYERIVQEGPGMYECVCRVTKNRVGFRVACKRLDITEPNRMNPTIASCIKLTHEGFYIQELAAYLKEKHLKRKRVE